MKKLRARFVEMLYLSLSIAINNEYFYNILVSNVMPCHNRADSTPSKCYFVPAFGAICDKSHRVIIA